MPTGPLGGYRPQADIHLEGFGGGGFGGGRNVRSRPSRILPSRKPSVRLNRARKMAQKAAEKKRITSKPKKPFQRPTSQRHIDRIARDVGERRSMASVEKFIKKEGRWPTMNESDRFAQTEYLKGMDRVYNFFKHIKPAKGASSLRGRYSKGKQ